MWVKLLWLQRTIKYFEFELNWNQAKAACMCTCTTKWHMWLCYYGNRSNIGCEHVYMYVQRHDTCDYVTTVTGLKSSIGYVHVYSEMMIALYSAILRSRAERCTYSAGMAGATWNCCRLGASSVYTIQPCTVLLYVFSYNMPPALLAEWSGSFTCYCGNTEQKVDHGEEKSPAAPAGMRSSDLSITSPAL